MILTNELSLTTHLKVQIKAEEVWNYVEEVFNQQPLLDEGLNYYWEE